MASRPQPINVADLDVSQLSDVRRQLEEVCPIPLLHRCDTDHSFKELNHLTNSFAQLKQAQAKFKTCMENVGEIKPQNKGISYLSVVGRHLTMMADKTILVPLTNSLYVPGKLSDPNHVIVDIGTGYFVKKVSNRYRRLQIRTDSLISDPCAGIKAL